MANKHEIDSFLTLLQAIEKLGAAYPSIAVRMPQDLDQKSFEAMSRAFGTAMSEVHAREIALTEARNVRRDQQAAARRFLKRARSAVALAFGEDSVELATVGGTRTSQRQRPVRHPKAAVPAPSATAPN